MPAADLEEALQKKGGLSLAQLMVYDDIATDALVDKVYFWSTIRKARPNTRPSRGIREQEICDIIQKTVIIEKDAATAQELILQQHGIIAFMRTLGTVDEEEHFERHIRKYINIYLPDCPFEVCTTHRYTIVNAEACVIARKPIRAGDSIKYLTGIQVELTEEEEEGLSSRTDFSIVLSSRRKRPSLFLGPARFANHDCDSNARLTTTGAHGLSIVARRSIAIGEEITVTYGDDYFGEDNCECLCGTCERLVRNGWDPRGPIIHDDSSDDEAETSRHRAKRQRLGQSSDPSGIQPLDLPHGHNMRREQGDGGASTPDQPIVRRKRGRPRKHPLPPHKVTPAHTMNARTVLSQWFNLRSGRGVYDGDSDFIRVKTKSSRRTTDDLYNADDIPDDKKHYKRVHNMFDIMTDRGSSQVREMTSKLSIMNSMTAKILHTAADQVAQYYYPPGHKNHVPLPTPPPEEHELAKLKVEPTEEREIRVQHVDLSSPRGSLNVNTSTITTSAMAKHAANSPLRKVTLAAQESEQQQPQRIQEPPPQDPPKRKRGRPRKHPLPEPVVAPTPVETTSTVTREPTHASLTTDNSSTSSIFSREGQRGHVSSNSSVSETELFSTGNNICQNIVEMFTSDSHADDRDSSLVRNRGRPARRTRSVAGSAQDATSRPGTSDGPHTVVSIESDHGDEHAEPTANTTSRDKEKEEKRGTPRIPGDYHMTEALLIDINDRWIECRNCDEYFVQHDAYLTRIACPRCERHSKLYGYYWPKTDKLGRDDREERVLDHRLIHRFIEPEEERHERKGRKTLLDVIKDRELSSSQEVDSDERGRSRDDSRRRSRRVVYW